jgi:hypothetical protein
VKIFANIFPLQSASGNINHDKKDVKDDLISKIVILEIEGINPAVGCIINRE